MLLEIVDTSYAKAEALRKSEGHITLERGFATIPLPGIDVPFHSRYLWAGVMPFRACKLDYRVIPSSFLTFIFTRLVQEDQPRAARS